MYYNENPEVRIIDIMINTARTTYRPWLTAFGKPYWDTQRSLQISNIQLTVPDFWPKATQESETPEWATKSYSYEQLNKDISNSAAEFLYSVGVHNQEEFEKLFFTYSMISFYIIEGLRLHIMSA